MQLKRLLPAINILHEELVQEKKERKVKNLISEQNSSKNSNFVFKSGPKRANFSLSEDPEAQSGPGLQKIDFVFDNIQPYFLEKTNYFTRFDLIALAKLLFGLVFSNLDVITIIYITYTHLLNGGLYAIIQFTIIFFILLEERAGRFKLWRILGVIYFIVLARFSDIEISNFNIRKEDVFHKNNLLPSQEEAAKILFQYGRVESKDNIILILILIICIQIIFDRIGILNKDLMQQESLGVCVHRIVINDDFFRIYEAPLEGQLKRIAMIEKSVISNMREKVSINSAIQTLSKIMRVEASRIIWNKKIE